MPIIDFEYLPAAAIFNHLHDVSGATYAKLPRGTALYTKVRSIASRYCEGCAERCQIPESHFHGCVMDDTKAAELYLHQAMKELGFAEGSVKFKHYDITAENLAYYANKKAKSLQEKYSSLDSAIQDIIDMKVLSAMDRPYAVITVCYLHQYF